MTIREMTDKTTEALKLAEEALVEYRDNQYIKAPRRTLAAIREVLAEPDIEEMTLTQIASRHEPVQEPVAWLYDWEYQGEIVTGWVTQDFETTEFDFVQNVRPLYAAAPGRDIEEAVKAERQEISKTFWAAVNSCITTEELGIEFMNKFYPVHIFGHWLDENENGHHHRYAGSFGG